MDQFNRKFERYVKIIKEETFHNRQRSPNIGGYFVMMFNKADLQDSSLSFLLIATL